MRDRYPCATPENRYGAGRVQRCTISPSTVTTRSRGLVLVVISAAIGRRPRSIHTSAPHCVHSHRLALI
jgi:hypothetical protein